MTGLGPLLVNTALAEVMRRALTEGKYSLCGSELKLDVTLKITGNEFDVIWDELEAIEGSDGAMLSLPAPPAKERPQPDAGKETR